MREKERASLVAQMVKNPPAKAGDAGLIHRSGRSPCLRKWQPTPVFLPGNSMIEEPGGLQSMGVAKSWTWLTTYAHAHRRKRKWRAIKSNLLVRFAGREIQHEKPQVQSPDLLFLPGTSSLLSYVKCFWAWVNTPEATSRTVPAPCMKGGHVFDLRVEQLCFLLLEGSILRLGNLIQWSKAFWPGNDWQQV